MKGIDLRKIGAIVAGATILASSVAFAGLMYENQELVNANGQPVVKVVVGEKAAASDGVVAATIAAKLASAAYKKTTLTAAAVADAVGTCGVVGNATNASTCEISNERVTLEVTVPGTVSSGVHEFSTLIADYVDKKLQNRYTKGTDDKYALTEEESDDVESNPFDVEGGSNSIAVAQENLYKIGKDNFAPFASLTITDPDSGGTYTESQAVWFAGTTKFSSSNKAIEANPGLLVYQVKFDETTHTGIPVCTEDEDSDKNWADCADSDSEFTGKHRVKINFLGSEWIMIDLNVPTADAVNEEEVEIGGSLVLAKESMYGIINVGDSITSKDGQLKIRLDDISSLEDKKPAMVSYIDANNKTIGQDQILPGTTKKKTIGSNTYKIRVYQTAPGYSFVTKWAEMALIENELTLKDGESIDDDKNEDWTVNLLWKNREASTASNTTKQVDALRGIIAYRTSFDALAIGGSLNVAEDPVNYKLTFKGLNLASADYDNLIYTAVTDGDLKPSMDDGNILVLKKYIKVTSDVTDAFTISGNDNKGNPVTGKGKEFYYVMADGLVDVNVINGQFDMDYDGVTANDSGDNGTVVTDAGIRYRVIAGKVDVAAPWGTIDAADNATNLVFDGDQVDIIVGQVDVNEDTVINASDNATNLLSSSTAGDIVMRKSGDPNKYVIIDADGTSPIVKYKTAGGGDTDDGGVIRLSDDVTINSTTTVQPLIELLEDIGTTTDATTGTKDDHAIGIIQVTYDYNGDNSFEDNNDGDDDQITFDIDTVNNDAELKALGYVDEGTPDDFDEGEFISPRGTKFDSMSSSKVTLKVAKKLGLAKYEFATTAAANASSSATQITLAEGETKNVGDVSIKARSIDQTVGSCVATGPSATCTIPKAQIKAVIVGGTVPNATTVDAVEAIAIDPRLVILDKDAAGMTDNLLITVGGNAVNTVTAGAMADAKIDFVKEPVVAGKVIGKRIIVAGYSAADTVKAGEVFLANIKGT